MSEDNESTVFPHSLARIRVEELKKDLIERVKREFLDFHMSFPESKLTSAEHFEFVKLLIELENLIDSV